MYIQEIMGPTMKMVYWVLLWAGVVFPRNLSSQNKEEPLQLKTVVIDPGHGGFDPGAVSAGVKEKNIVLDVGLMLGNKIKKAFPDIKVHYTRSKDIFIPLYARAAFANRNKADLFISLHANWAAVSSARGTETYTLGLYRSQENLDVAKKENSVILLEDDYTTNYEGFNPNETESYIMFENMQSEFQTQSIDLAARVQKEFTKTTKLSNRGVKQAGFLVLRQTTMPCALVEMGFISNPAERKILTSEAGKEKIAESIFKAFSSYKKSIDSKSGFNVTPLAGVIPAGKTKDTVSPAQEPADNQITDVSPGLTDKKPQKTTGSTGNGKNQGKKTISTEKKSPVSDKTVPLVSSNQPGNEKTVANDETANSVGSPVKETSLQDAVTAEKSGNSVWYSVQVKAATNNIEPSEKNFKGETGIIRIKVTPYYKYYSGRYNSAKEAFSERSRLLKKFPDAFAVIVENGVSRPLKNSDLR